MTTDRPSNAELRELRNQLIELIETANGYSAEARAYLGECREASVELSALSSLAGEVKLDVEAIDTAKAHISATKTDIESLQESAASLTDQATNDSKMVTESLGNVEKLEKRVNDLMPAATSAGLASAFAERKASFKYPKIMWAGVFFASIAALIFVPIYFKPEVPPNTLELIYLYLLARLPFMAPLVWLAYYASQRSTQALRLEEDYAHKEALSKSFEGYKNQIIALEKAWKDSNTEDQMRPTLNLIDKTIKALSLHPDRIYKSHKEGGPFSNFFASLLNSNKTEVK